MADRRRPRAVMFVILFLLGLFVLLSVTGGPHFESYRTLDVIRLVLSGVCFGVALTGAIATLLRRTP